MSLGRRTVHRWGREEFIDSIKIALLIAVLQHVLWIVSAYSLVTYTAIPIEQWGELLLVLVGLIPAATSAIVLMTTYRSHGLWGVMIYSVVAGTAAYGLGSFKMSVYIILGAWFMAGGMFLIFLLDELERALRYG